MQETTFCSIIEQFEQFITHTLVHYEKCALLIDQNVLPILPIKENPRILVLSFDAKEENKTREKKLEIENALLEFGLKRKDCLIAIGGGITTDLGGFIASTYHRGIDLIFIPTTLLAMVDAAIGGKNGVNTPYGKNTIGSFYLPKKTLLDMQFLKTLPAQEVLNGLGEILKYGIIYEPKIFNHLEEQEIFSKKLIQICIDCKNQIVQDDLYESNQRALLNFGHTVGHALEIASNYIISHGIAVFYGMLIEIEFSSQFLEKKQFLLNCMKKFHFPSINREKIDQNTFINALKQDKKNSQQGVKIVSYSPYLNCQNLPILQTVSAELLTKKTWEFFLKEFQ
jgi:3-dehydroquinate synthase